MMNLLDYRFQDLPEGRSFTSQQDIERKKHLPDDEEELVLPDDFE